jgi:hypothetical protein
MRGRARGSRIVTLANRALEWARHRRPAFRELAARARGASKRPLVIVPSVLGTRIADRDGRVLWGTAVRLYAGPPVATAEGTPAGLLDGFTIVPGVLAYDVFGGLVRALVSVGGYSRDALAIVEYDWRASVGEAADRVCDAIAAAGTEADVVAISSGGLAVRHALARGARAGRVVYIGTPQRGTFQSLSYLHDGLRMVPLGRKFSPAELAACKTSWDTLPHPDEPVFLDARGEPLERSLYDPETWRRFRLGDPGAHLVANLERAAALHRALDRAAPHADSVVIGARHLPTLSRMQLVRDRAVLPACSPRRGDPLAPRLFEPGDSALPARSLDAVPGIDASRIHAVTPRLHRMLPADPDVHRALLSALL